MLRYFLVLFLGLLSANALAQSVETPVELQSFEIFSDTLPLDEFGQERGVKRTVRQQEIIPYIKSLIPDTAAYNLSNSEQVFCYHIAKRPADYKGYTLDGMAITGFCGELDINQTTTAYEALFTQSPNIITSVADCRIEPRIMLRFIRGIDSTDVLLSSPCPSFTVFYAGKYKSFNIKQAVIEDIIQQLTTSNTPFNSPALLGQTIANANPNTTEEEEILKKKQQDTEPIMNWKQQTEQQSPEPAKQKTGGWGNLNFKLKNTPQ